jgi:ABC-2 type transport system permease protein
MNPVLVVAKKEMVQIAHTKSAIVSGLIFAVIFGGMAAPTAVMQQEMAPGLYLDALLVSLVLPLGIFMGYLFSSQAFLREKQTGIIETLLCAPLSLRNIWCGKLVGVLVPAYIMAIVAAGIIAGVANAVSPAALVPSAEAVLAMLTVIPAYIALTIGVIGYIQFLLGMREVQIFNVVVLLALIFMISLAEAVILPGLAVTLPSIAVLLAVAAVLLAVVWAAAGRLSREKIVRTIP